MKGTWQNEKGRGGRSGGVRTFSQSFFFFLARMSALGCGAPQSFLLGCCCTQRLGVVLNDGQAALTEWELEAIRSLWRARRTSVARLKFTRTAGNRSPLIDCSLSRSRAFSPRARSRLSVAGEGKTELKTPFEWMPQSSEMLWLSCV